MKFRKLLGGGLLAAVLVLGGVAGLATRSESKSVSATDASSFSFAADSNEWSKTAEPFTNNGSNWVLTRKIESGDKFKFVANGGDVWIGYYDGGNYASGCFKAEWNNDGDNFVCLSTNVYDISLPLNYQEYGEKKYGVSITINPNPTFTVSEYAVKDGVLDTTALKSSDQAFNSTFNAPLGIHIPNYSFEGWYTSDDLSTEFVSRVVDDDFAIYGKYTSHGSWSGTINVDLSSSGWAGSAANYAMYFWDDTTYSSKKEGWSSYVTGTPAETNYLEIPYSLDFEPLQMIFVRYNSDLSPEDWATNKWNKNAQTDDASFANKITVIHNTEYDTYWLQLNAFATIMGGPDDDHWETIATLSSYKKNGSNHTEYYAEVTLTAGYDFKVVYDNNTYYNGYSTHDSIASEFTYNGKDSNINAVKGGVYELYFDTFTNNLYITTATLAEADEWAQLFLKGVTCDGDGSITKDQWSTLSGSYALLSEDAKDVFEKIPTHGKEDGTYAEAAVARYDYILIKYGIGASAPKHTDFMGRFSEGGINQNVPTAQAPISVFGSMDNSTPIMLVVIISVVSLTAVGGYIFLKRRKEN